MNAMIVGVPKEVKVRESRVALIPSHARSLVEAGITVLVETGAGMGSGIPDDEYRAAGASIAESARAVYAGADMVYKVKDPVESEWPLLRDGQILYAFLHLAAAPGLARVLQDKRIDAVAFETVTNDDGTHPILTPMSEVAGKMSVQVGAHFLQKDRGGKGILLGGVPGVRHGRVTILGGGVVGLNAAKVAVGFGAEVRVLDVSLERLAHLDDLFRGTVTTLMSNSSIIEDTVRTADLVVGAVLKTGARADRVVTRAMVSSMEPRSVIVDVAIDQGGCVETIRPTTHEDPVYEECGIIHYGVTNMPGAVPQTSTAALANATFPFALEIARRGLDGAIAANPRLAGGVNTRGGRIVHPAVAAALGVNRAD